MNALNRLYTDLFIYILLVSAGAVAIKTTETREIQIGLKSDGNLIDSEFVPKCGPGQKIHLLSYMNHELQCHFSDGCSSVHEEPLRPSEALQLHQMCSMKEKCKNLSFSLSSEIQEKQTNSIIILYECVDQLKLVNICEKTERTFTDDVYLTSLDIKEPFKECQCFVNSGRFSIIVLDIRLNINMDNKCSPASLHINDKEYLCDENKDDYGAVFTRSSGKPLRNSYISLVQNSKTNLPEMVLIKLQPERSLRIICEGQQTSKINNASRSTILAENTCTSKVPTTTTMPAEDDATNGIILSATNDLQAHSNVEVKLLAVVIIMLAIVILMILIFGVWTHRRKFFRSNPVRENEIGKNCTIQTKNDLSAERVSLLEQPLANMDAEGKETVRKISSGQPEAKMNVGKQIDEDSAYSSSTDTPVVSLSDEKNNYPKVRDMTKHFNSNTARLSLK